MYKLMNNKKFYLTVAICMTMLFGMTIESAKSHAATIASSIYKITLQSLYVDGEMSEEISFKEIASVEDIMQQYDEWELVWKMDKEVVFQKRINDISPLLKANGYFGVTEDGVLSIFNGKPTDSDVIHSFFQINVEMLEVKKQNELGEGIRVKDRQQYEAVLEAFEPYME